MGRFVVMEVKNVGGNLLRAAFQLDRFSGCRLDGQFVRAGFWRIRDQRLRRINFSQTTVLIADISTMGISG